MGLYTRRQLLLLLGLVAAAGLGLAVGHWRAHHPALTDRLESLDRGAGAAATSSTSLSRAPSDAEAHDRPAAGPGSAGQDRGRPHPARAPEPRAPAPPPSGRGDRAPGPAVDVSPGASPPADAAPGSRIDLNRAGLEELIRLPGVGPALASRIIETREAHGPFTAVEDLRRVRGVGPTKLERLRAHATVGE